jgi:hypothetical protein
LCLMGSTTVDAQVLPQGETTWQGMHEKSMQSTDAAPPDIDHPGDDRGKLHGT